MTPVPVPAPVPAYASPTHRGAVLAALAAVRSDPAAYPCPAAESALSLAESWARGEPSPKADLERQLELIAAIREADAASDAAPSADAARWIEAAADAADLVLNPRLCRR